MRHLAPLALAALLVAPAAGCEDANAQEHIRIGPGDLPPSAGLDATGEGWQSVGWSGDPWQPYPGRATLEFTHDLGRIPTSVLVYLAFDRGGTGAGLASGDLARIIEVTETTVTIRNDTEAELFCRVTLQ